MRHERSFMHMFLASGQTEVECLGRDSRGFTYVTFDNIYILLILHFHFSFFFISLNVYICILRLMPFWAEISGLSLFSFNLQAFDIVTYLYTLFKIKDPYYFLGI